MKDKFLGGIQDSFKQLLFYHYGSLYSEVVVRC